MIIKRVFKLTEVPHEIVNLVKPTKMELKVIDLHNGYFIRTVHNVGKSVSVFDIPDTKLKETFTVSEYNKIFSGIKAANLTYCTLTYKHNYYTIYFLPGEVIMFFIF